MHEGRHCETKAGDYDRTFVNRADKDAATAVFANPMLAGDPSAIVATIVEPPAKGKAEAPKPVPLPPDEPSVIVEDPALDEDWGSLVDDTDPDGTKDE